MKRVFTLAIIALFGLQAGAQSFITSPKESSVTGPFDEYELVAHAKVYNINADSLFTWIRFENTQSAGWEGSICDKVTCWAPTVDSSSFYLAPGDSSIMDAHFYMNENYGNSTMKFIIWSGTDKANADTIIYNASTWAMSTRSISKNKSVRVYPNPSSGVLNLEFSSEGNVKLEVYDLLGKKMRDLDYQGTNSSFDLADLPDGLYIIRINDDGHIYSRTFRKAN